MPHYSKLPPPPTGAGAYRSKSLASVEIFVFEYFGRVFFDWRWLFFVDFFWHFFRWVFGSCFFRLAPTFFNGFFLVFIPLSILAVFFSTGVDFFFMDAFGPVETQIPYREFSFVSTGASRLWAHRDSNSLYGIFRRHLKSLASVEKNGLRRQSVAGGGEFAVVGTFFLLQKQIVFLTGKV